MKIYEISTTDLYSLEPIEEGASQIFGRTGRTKAKGKAKITTQRFRCPTGPRKGRIVGSPSVCTQPKKLGSVMAIKKAKARRGSTMKIKRAFTKRTASPSVRLGRLNKQRASRNRPARRSMSGRRMSGTRKSIRKK